MTNKEKIKIMNDKELAELLIHHEVTEEVLYYTPDGFRFDAIDSAIKHTIIWLNSDEKEIKINE